LTITALLAVVALAGGCNSAIPKSGAGSDSRNGSTPHLTVSYSEDVADELPLWIAADGGYFAKHGLDVQLTSITGNQGIPALLSGQTQFASIGGSAMLSAVAGGASLQYLATLTPIYAYLMYAQPKFNTPDKLKGQRVGITTASGSLYIGTVLALKDLGLSPSDVTITPLGSVANVNSALLSGSIAAAVAHPPDTTRFAEQGLLKIDDVAQKKIPAALVGITSTSSYIQAHPDVVQRFIDALLEAIGREKTDKAYAQQELQKYLKVTDTKALDETYAYYANGVLPSVPLPRVNQFQASQESLAKTNAKVGQLDLSKLVDPRFVQSAASSLNIKP
jgi:NitT/TauT family transport system substrate-binding protein